MTSYPTAIEHDHFELLFDVASAAARVAAQEAQNAHGPRRAMTTRSAHALDRATSRGTSASAIELRRRLSQV